MEHSVVFCPFFGQCQYNLFINFNLYLYFFGPIFYFFTVLEQVLIEFSKWLSKLNRKI